MITKGNLTGDQTIRDQTNAEGISILNLLELVGPTSKKTKSGQTFFIPSTADQFLEMLRAFKILLKFLGGPKSAITIQSKRLYSQFKKEKLSLKEFFIENKEDYCNIFALSSTTFFTHAQRHRPWERSKSRTFADEFAPQSAPNWHEHSHPKERKEKQATIPSGGGGHRNRRGGEITRET